MSNSTAVTYASRAKRAADNAVNNSKDYGTRYLAEAVRDLARAIEEIARKQN